MLFQPFLASAIGLEWRSRVLSISVVFLIALHASSTAQSKEIDANKAKPVEQNAPSFVGSFEGSDLFVKVDESNGKFTGSLKKGDKTFDFVAKRNGQTLSGEINLGAAKSPFTATVKGDLFVLTMGLNTFELTRIREDSPSLANAFLGRYVGDGWVLIFEKKNGETWGKIEQGENTADFSGTAVDRTFHGVLGLKKEGARFVATYVNGEIVLKLADKSVRLRRLVRNTTRRFITMATDANKAIQRSIVVSPDHKRVVHFQQVGSRQHVMINGKQGSGFFLAGGARISPDSQRVSFMCQDNGKFHVVIDGNVSDAFDQARMPRPMYSSDSQRVVFVAGRGAKAWVDTDGVAGTKYDRIQGTVFSPNSKRVAYAARDGNRWHVVLDHQPGSSFDAIIRGEIFFSSDSERVAYVAGKSGKEFVVINGIAGKPYDAVTNITFSPDSKHVAFVAYQGAKMIAVVDGVESQPYDKVEQFVFSQDSKHLAYAAKQASVWTLVVDGNATGQFDAIGEITFNPADNSIAYAAKNGDRWSATIRGKAYGAFSMIKGLRFGKDGRRWSYLGQRKGKWRVVIDNRTSPAYDQIRFDQVTFDPTGKNAAYVARRDGETYIVVNGVEDKPVGRLVPNSTVRFLGQNQLSAVVVQNNEVARLEIQIAK